MCGIAGTIGFADLAVINAMTAALRHRGPDDGGTRVDPGGAFAFGHRRLAIIDLSPAGHQPMSWADGRFWITYNGEIYNYLELRGELEARGCSFRTRTDTEVLLAAYATWGEDCLHRLRGMFAFAIADTARRRVFLARDRFGVKPLLYAETHGGLFFASELRSFTAAGQVPTEIDRDAVWHYLSFGSVPLPRTIFRQVRSLLPGHALSVGFDVHTLRTWRWWDIATAAQAHAAVVARLDFPAAAEALRERLDEATRYHLVADVPVGAFLSGGVDSAAMVALMRRHVSAPIRTFTVAFGGQHQNLSEAEPAARTARALGTQHQEVTVDDAAAASSFDALLDALDQPSLDGANTWFVARAAAASVKVALTGLGGDEIFAGYPHFRRHQLAARLRSACGGVPTLLTPLRRLPDRCRHNLMLPALDERERLGTLRSLMALREKRRVLNPDFLASVTQDPPEALLNPDALGLDTIARLSQAELEGYMARTLLRDGDVMSMAHGLETRPILLDHELAAFAFALPSAYKLRHGRGKAIFQAALAGLLPDEIAQRPKRGFELPLLRWLSGPLLERADAALSSAAAQTLFQPRFLADSRARLRAPQPRDVRLWPYVVLSAWLQRQRLSL
jgi:asparagine synthase (glutamine-hydrolysing)